MSKQTTNVELKKHKITRASKRPEKQHWKAPNASSRTHEMTVLKKERKLARRLAKCGKRKCLPFQKTLTTPRSLRVKLSTSWTALMR